MKAKCVIIFVAAFIALPALADHISNIQLGETYDQLLETAQQALQTISQVVKDATEKLVTDLQEMLRHLDILKTEAFRVVPQAIEAEMLIIHEMFGEVKALVIEDLDLLKCINDEEQQLSSVQDEAADYSFSCITLAAQQVGDDTEKTLFEINLLSGQIIAAQQHLEHCNDNDFPLDCVKQVINETIQLALFTPSELQLDADKTHVDFDNLIVAFQNCITDASNIIKEEGTQIYNNITQCIKNDDYDDDNDYDYYDDFLSNGDY